MCHASIHSHMHTNTQVCTRKLFYLFEYYLQWKNNIFLMSTVLASFMSTLHKLELIWKKKPQLTKWYMRQNGEVGEGKEEKNKEIFKWKIQWNLLFTGKGKRNHHIKGNSPRPLNGKRGKNKKWNINYFRSDKPGTWSNPLASWVAGLLVWATKPI